MNKKAIMALIAVIIILAMITAIYINARNGSQLNNQQQTENDVDPGKTPGENIDATIQEIEDSLEGTDSGTELENLGDL